MCSESEINESPCCALSAAVRRQDVRNVAIIAHVDHGKTLLVDCMLRQSGRFRETQLTGQQILDTNDLERERGITILAKNIAIPYRGVKINIIDTPGHADFGGEVERVLRMADGALVLVDAAEGPMPQTRFVLSKALECGLRPVIVINKIDRPDARADEVIDEVFDLFMQLGAEESLADFPYIFTSAKLGFAAHDAAATSGTIVPLMDLILEKIPGPEIDDRAPLQMLVTTLDWSDYVGRIAIGRIYSGEVRPGQDVALMQKDGQAAPARIVAVHVFEDLGRVEVESGTAGDIVALVGTGKRGNRRHDQRSGVAPGAAPRGRRRADAEDDLRREHLAAGRAGRAIPHQPAPPRATAAGNAKERRPARRADRRHGVVLRLRPRHPPPLRAHRNHAPRGLRDLHRQAAGHPPRAQKASSKSRSKASWSKSPRRAPGPSWKWSASAAENWWT